MGHYEDRTARRRWTMMFADDSMVCSQSRQQVEEHLERLWRFDLERGGLTVNCR